MDLCSRWPGLAPRDHVGDSLSRPLEDRLHSPVGEVPDPAADAAGLGLLPAALAEPHPLHATANEDMPTDLLHGAVRVSLAATSHLPRLAQRELRSQVTDGAGRQQNS